MQGDGDFLESRRNWSRPSTPGRVLTPAHHPQGVSNPKEYVYSRLLGSRPIALLKNFTSDGVAAGERTILVLAWLTVSEDTRDQSTGCGSGHRASNHSGRSTLTVVRLEV